MDSTAKMLTFGTGAFLFSVLPAAFLIFVSTVLLEWGYGHRSVVVPAVRHGLADRPFRAVRAGFAPLALLTAVVLPLAVAACYWRAFYVVVGGAFDWDPPDATLHAVTVPLGLAAAVPTCLYVASGGRRGYGLYPPIPVRPWAVVNDLRVAAAIRIVRHAQLVAVTATSWMAALYAAGKRSDAGSGDRALLYLAGAAPMVVLALTVQAKLRYAYPRAAAHRLVLQMLAAAPEPPRGAKPAGRRPQAITGQVRANLLTLCQLLDRVAAAEARAEAAAGVQNVGALTFRSAAGNLRTFLSNRVSLTRSVDDIRGDLLLISAVLAQPRSAAALTELATRMGAFDADGSLKEPYRAAHRNRVAAGLDHLTLGLDRTHQIVIRLAVVGLVGLALYQFAKGQMALSDLFKAVKL